MWDVFNLLEKVPRGAVSGNTCMSANTAGNYMKD
jgi:hypothetical protein